MLKASCGGGGRGMRVVRDGNDLHDVVARARQEAKTSFGNDEVFFEKLVEDALHIEVQILGDHYGNVVHLYERDCSLQRRHQKVIERAPAINLAQAIREEICRAAVTLARNAGVNNAATVEFLYDKAGATFYFIEVNPRLQVEHTVTEEITGIDVVKAQIRIAQGEKIGRTGSMVPSQSAIRVNGTALQCRVTAEDPNNNFIPDYGNVIAYRSPAGTRNTSRWRRRLHRGVDLTGLRQFAGKNHCARQRRRGKHQPHETRPAGVPDTRRSDQFAIFAATSGPSRIPLRRLQYPLY